MKRSAIIMALALGACGSDSTSSGPDTAASDTGADATAQDTAAPVDIAPQDSTLSDLGLDAGPLPVDVAAGDMAAADVPPEDAAQDALDAGPPDAGPEDVAPPLDVKAPDYPLDDVLRLNHLQALGTHNSYHVEPPDTTLSDWAYSHVPLDEQAGDQGVRQFELDVHLDLMKGFQVSHIPILDGETTCATLHGCLSTLYAWSNAHPGHHALFVFIEPKDDVDATKLKGHIAELDTAILEVWPRERVLTPDDVRGTHATLRDAILTDGWPTLGETRGKLVVTLLDHGSHREEYLLGHPSLEGRVLFASGAMDAPYAGIMLLDDPVGGADDIAAAVAAGFIVRTRADTQHGTLVEAQTARRDIAFASGAHLISSDYPAPVEGIDYVCEVPGGKPSRCNPITAPNGCMSADIEALGL